MGGIGRVHLERDRISVERLSDQSRDKPKERDRIGVERLSDQSRDTTKALKHDPHSTKSDHALGGL